MMVVRYWQAIQNMNRSSLDALTERWGYFDEGAIDEYAT
jgi:hypothetical protein